MEVEDAILERLQPLRAYRRAKTMAAAFQGQPDKVHVGCSYGVFRRYWFCTQVLPVFPLSGPLLRERAAGVQGIRVDEVAVSAAAG